MDTQAVKKEKINWLSLILIFVIGTLFCAIYSLAVYIGPLSVERGWAPEETVLTFTFSMFVTSPAFIIGGLLLKKIPAKPLVVVCVTAYGLCIAASGMVHSVVGFIILQGILCGLLEYIAFVGILNIINKTFPSNQGLATGVLYGSTAVGSAILAPAATYLCTAYSVSTALIIQGIIVAVLAFIATMLLKNPKTHDAAADAAAEEMTEIHEEYGMNWKQMIKSSSFYMLFIAMVLTQLIGNVLVTDTAYIAEGTLGVDPMKSAFVISAFNIAAGLGGIGIGMFSDKIGPVRTLTATSIFNAALLVIMALLGVSNFYVFAIIVTVQGFTFNGLTTLSPVIIGTAYGQRNLGVNIGVFGIASMIVGFIGPQLGLMVSPRPMFLICAAACVAGAFLSIGSGKAVNRHYKADVIK